MIDSNSYLEIARRAKKGVLAMYGIGAENEFAASAQKVAERYLKAVIEKYPDKRCSSNILRTHSLRSLYGNLKHLNYLSISEDAINKLNGYYFEASYPGDNFILVTKEQETECYESLIEISDKVEKFFSEAQTTNEF